jgi:hypothetical protein
VATPHGLTIQDFPAQLYQLYLRHTASLTVNRSNFSSMRSDFYQLLRAAFPMLEAEYFSNVFNASGVFPIFFSYPARPRNGPSDWMFGAHYNAYSSLWTRSGIFNCEFSRKQSDENPIVTACSHARTSADAMGAAPFIAFGVFPDTNASWLRTIISRFGGVLGIVFPPGSVPFVHIHSLFGRSKLANSPFKSGVVIASFRSRGYRHSPPFLAGKKEVRRQTYKRKCMC